MKKAMIKVLSLAMALTLVASLAACGGNSEEETTTSAENTTIGEVVPGDDVSADGETPADESTEPATDANGNTVAPAATQKPGEPTKAPATPGKPNAPADKTSLTNEEAVALFNKATVGVKKNGTRTTNVDLVEVPVPGFVKNIIQSGIKSSAKPISLTEVTNQKMNVSDFSSIKAVKSGNNWVLTMTVKTEVAPNVPANARAFAELPQKEIDAWVGAGGKLSVKNPESIKFTYSGGTIVATVTSDGKLVNATYTMKVGLVAKNVDAVVNISGAKVNVTQIDKF